ncbi:acyl-CoA dehydrogenase family protein [Fulvimarina sp. MAC8]|uniref:acyl-CoA dehydrogenase family protein n=1 Tax=Fulvimarina sp. MAC8 TaxID=3162874 RepID=UPI0032EFE6F6
MRHRSLIESEALALSDGLSALSAAYEQEAAYPHSSFSLLSKFPLGSHPPLDPADVLTLLQLLAAVGRGDLSVGRIYEGHVNALLLIKSFGTERQRALIGNSANGGHWFGVWNTDAPDRPLREIDGALRGAKNFASGVDGLNRAIVTVPSDGGRQMFLVPLTDLPVDRSWWDPMGMRGSGSHVVDFTGFEVTADHRLGRAGDYTREPWFSGGAIRFAAVQTGGLHAVFDIALAHLKRTGRADDPYQAHRLAKMGIAVDSAYGWIAEAAHAWSAAASDPDDIAAGRRLVAVSQATRSSIEASALAVLEDAERAVGAAGFNRPHPLERRIRDLRTYLRQPNPDGALRSLGKAIAAGDWAPGRVGRS